MRKISFFKWLGILMMVLALALLGCEGDDGEVGPAGPAGPQGPPGETASGTVSGMVTNSLTGNGQAGVTVETMPDVGVDIVTDANGRFSAQLPVGSYTLMFNRDNFNEATESLTLVAGSSPQLSVSLDPMNGVAVDAVDDLTAATGEAVPLSAEVTVLNGATGTPTYAWRQVAGATASIANGNTANPTVTLGQRSAYRGALYDHLETLDRFMVQGINPLALEEAGMAVFEVDVTVDGRTYTDKVAVHTPVPYAVSAGIRTVPTGSPVLLHGAEQASYNWSVVAPSGTTVALDSPTVRNPSFTPTEIGQHTVTETVSGTTIEVFAGEWRGIITGKDADGRPIPDAGCLGCHNDANAPDKFTPWAQTGHAEIFQQNLDTSTHYGESCFPCHTVGFNPEAGNNGIDDQPDYQNFLNAGLLNNPGDNWTTTLNQFPDTARMGNVQCENCHGPQNNQGAHAEGAPRVSVSSDVCATCHGEPPRHARYQQWEESGHADFELAIEEGTRGFCSPCHTGNGFIQWAAAGFDKDASVPGFAADEIQPVTCAACHEPHEQGTSSGKPNTATVRVAGTTPELRGGFIATGVGRGAVCMICHNSRRAPFSTSLYGENYFNGSVDMEDNSTHPGPQGDILMGENGFFVRPGARGAHSYITDTCTNCHMELTDPPDYLSYNLSGTNHTFEASPTICANCHGEFDGGSIQATVTSLMDELLSLIEGSLLTDIRTLAGQATGVLLDYDSGDNNYGAIIDASGAAANTIQSIAAQDAFPHGYDITLVNGTEVGTAHSAIVLWQDANNDGVVDAGEVQAGDTNGEGIVDSTVDGIATNGQNIAKAKWNHDLVHADGSHGIHNPDFVLDILNGSISALR